MQPCTPPPASPTPPPSHSHSGSPQRTPGSYRYASTPLLVHTPGSVPPPTVEVPYCWEQCVLLMVKLSPVVCTSRIYMALGGTALPTFHIQVASLASLAQLLPPHSATRVIRRQTALCAELLLPDWVRFCCCSPIASICFNCYFQLLLPDCIRFRCCSLIVSASAAAHRLHPLQLLLPDCIRFNCSRLRQLRLLLPDCDRFNCCSPIASALTTAPRLYPLVAPAVLENSSPCPGPMLSNILHRVRG